MVRKALIGTTDIFLVVLIFLNVLDFFEIIPSEFDYAKKILSWVLMGYLLYQVSLTHVLFGRKDGDIDALLIFSYFLLIVKNLISYAASAYATASSTMKPFFKLLIDNYASYELVTFIAGLIGLFLVALYVAYKVPFLKRSVMGVLHEEGRPKKEVKTFLARLGITLLVLLAFYLYVFNMIMEWLAIAIDAPLILAILLFYSIFMLRHRMSTHKYLQQIGTASDNFFKSIIDHFRYKESILLGLCGLLVLHLITDVGNFLIPYLTGLRDQLYFGFLQGAGRATVWGVLKLDMASLSGVFPTIGLLLIFIGNVLGIMLLFLSPAVLWYEMYRHRKPRLPKWWIIVFFSSLPAVILNPLFALRRLNTTNLVGVDVLTGSMLASQVSLALTVGMMLLFGLVAFASFKRKKLIKGIEQLWVAISTMFLGWYSLLFFIDVATYYQDVVFGFLRMGNWVMSIIFFVFVVLIIIFYVGGFGIFLYELVHRTRRKRHIT